MTNNKLTFTLAIAFALALGIYLAKWWYGNDDQRTVQESQVLLEQVKTVSKLVTTEGYFSEVFSESDTQLYWGVPSTKKILIKVKAKVMAGYDMTGTTVEADAATKTLRIKGIPAPSIIGIEPDISYYDITNGVFNQFSVEDYNRLNKKAVDIIREQAQKSSFMGSVTTQGQRNFDALRQLAEGMGWKVAFEGDGFKN
jgi:Protein of unknown function (DUF4230)